MSTKAMLQSNTAANGPLSFFTVHAVDLLGLSFTAIPDLHPEQKVTKVCSSPSFVWAMKGSENLWKTFGVNENQWKTNARKKEK